MLRRRILTSAMASVMALTSVAVVASADDTATSEKYVLDKAGLEALIKQYDADRTKVLDEYGSKCGQDFINALEYGDNVLADSNASTKDYTVAAQMIEATQKKLVQKTQAQLRDLIKECERIVDKTNILNEELGDLRYTAGSFEALEDALSEAESVVDSNDARLWTDSYFDLEAARDGLSEITPVSKSDFRKLLKDFDAAVAKEYKYEDWRKGTNWDNKTQTYGGAYTDLVNTAECDYTTLQERYDAINEIKGLSSTTQDDIVEAYKKGKELLDHFNAWKPDDTDRASKAKVTKLLDEYHGRLVWDYENTTAASTGDVFELVSKISGLFTGADAKKIKVEIVEHDVGKMVQLDQRVIDVAAGNKTVTDGIWYTEENSGKLVTAECNIRADVKIYVPLTEDGYWDTTDEPTLDVDEMRGRKYKTIAAKTKFDLTQLIALDDANVTDTPMDKAISLAYLYLDGSYKKSETENWVDDASFKINTAGAVAEGSAKGSAAEWAMVHRFLKYQLEDKYASSVGSLHKKSEVSKLYDDSYDLTDKTGDAPLFSVEHQHLMDVRKDVNDWLKQANRDKKYKDNESTYTVGVNEWNANDAYNTLNDAYKALKDQLDAFSCSFEDIYNYMYDSVISKVDDGTLKMTDDLKAALEDVAYKLSTLSSVYDSLDPWQCGGSDVDNDAFTTDRYFVGYNRLYTSSKDHGDFGNTGKITVTNDKVRKDHTALKEALQKLQTAVKAQTEPAFKMGDVDHSGGEANAADASLILQWIVGLDAAKSIDENLIDFNADGKKTADDATAILKKVAGITE